MDLETWSANENGFVRFLTFLIQVVAAQLCIFISGDVHYGFTVRLSSFLTKHMEKKIPVCL
jgi:hypothetical protein